MTKTQKGENHFRDRRRSTTLKRLVLESGISINKLSKMIGVEQQNLSSALNGNRVFSDKFKDEVLKAIEPYKGSNKQLKIKFEQLTKNAKS